jgi:hypothetical protein
LEKWAVTGAAGFAQLAQKKEMATNKRLMSFWLTAFARVVEFGREETDERAAKRLVHWRMSSEHRIRASRANGAKSRGPRTPESKLRSAGRNLRHVLLAGTVVLEDENLQPFADLLSALERDLDPQNEIERALDKNMAVRLLASSTSLGH